MEKNPTNLRWKTDSKSKPFVTLMGISKKTPSIAVSNTQLRTTKTRKNKAVPKLLKRSLLGYNKMAICRTLTI
jgi:hypothetical protein